MRLSDANLEILRTKPQGTRLYLSIFEPQIVFQAQINNSSIVRGAREIAYDTVSFGSFSNILSNSTMWIGTTTGAGDVGKIRVRSATSTIITVSENSNIEWADNLFLTVFKYIELWPIFPRIIQDPADMENVIFYKDFDISYSNQNSILGTYVNAGPHRAANLDPASGLTQLYWSSTGSYNLLGSSLTYYWSFEGGSPSTSNAAVPGFVSYNTPGHYVTSLIISGSNGASDITYRYVSIYNSANPPIQKWQMGDLTGSREEGGYTVSFKVFEDIPIQEHAVVVLYGDSWYGNNDVDLGGNFPNSSKIFFVGHVDKDSISYDYEHSEVSFDAHSITSMMKEASGFSVSVESVASPTTWYQLLDMDSRRALYHYLRWHTTALQISDFQFVGDDYKIQFFDSDRESMFDALDNYMRNTLIGQVVSDRQGKVWMETEARAYSNPTGSFPSVMNITNRDWMNTPTIDEQLSESVSFMEYGGIAYSGVVTGTFAALIASAPGNAPGFHGAIENHQGQALLGQSQLNSLVGNLLANKNARFPSIEMDMAENTSNLDIAPQETVNVNIAREDTIRGLAVNGLYIPNSMTWRYTPNGFILLPQIGFKQLVTGPSGETVPIPSTPEDGIGGGFNVPGLQIPSIPSLVNPSNNCCVEFDTLNLGNNVKCCTIIRYSFIASTDYDDTLSSASYYLLNDWDFSSNTRLHGPNVSTSVVVVRPGFPVTGTYSIELDFDYVDSSFGGGWPFHDNVWGVRANANSGVNSGAGYPEFTLTKSQIGSSGHFHGTGQASIPAPIVAPTATGIGVSIYGYSDVGIPVHLGPSSSFTISNLKLTICYLFSVP